MAYHIRKLDSSLELECNNEIATRKLLGGRLLDAFKSLYACDLIGLQLLKYVASLRRVIVEILRNCGNLCHIRAYDKA